MNNNNRIKLTNIIPKLSEETINTLFEAAASLLGKSSNQDNPACPYCGCSHVVKNGHKYNKQEYLCKDCTKTFVSTTNTIMAPSHQPREIWEEVITDTISSDAIDYSVKRLEISHNCVFYMRHKMLMALHDVLEEAVISLDEVTKVDEAFVLDCYKGSPLPPEARCQSPEKEYLKRICLHLYRDRARWKHHGGNSQPCKAVIQGTGVCI